MICEMSNDGRPGDVRIKWNSDNDFEVHEARKRFEELVKQGYRAFTLEKGGKPGEMIQKFDPKLERIHLAQPMRGG